MIQDQSPLPYSDDIETIPADEADDIERVVEATKILLARRQSKSGEFVADVHVKAHGYAEGKLRVLPNLPDELAQGLFGHETVYRTIANTAYGHHRQRHSRQLSEAPGVAGQRYLEGCAMFRGLFSRQ